MRQGYENIKISFGNANTIGKNFFTNQKTKTPTEIKSNIIYKIPCRDCSKCYVGQTGRYLKQRLSEHRRDQQKLNVINPTALVDRSRQLNHQFDFENTKVLKTERYLSKRLLHEMIFIKVNDTVNYRRDIENLNQSYFNITSKFPPWNNVYYYFPLIFLFCLFKAIKFIFLTPKTLIHKIRIRFCYRQANI